MIASPEAAATMAGDLVVPKDPTGLVVFAHCSGSSRYSPRNYRVAAILNRTRLATLLLDLLTPQEELDRRALLDVGRAARRLLAAAAWASEQPELPTGYFGAVRGAGAALWAAADAGETVSAVVSYGGRPELAGPRLADVHASVLLIVGGREAEVVDVNRQALLQLRGYALNIFPPRDPVLPRAWRARRGRAARGRLVQPPSRGGVTPLSESRGVPCSRGSAARAARSHALTSVGEH